jgi:two-component system OmpR family sensor kinase
MRDAIPISQRATLAAVGGLAVVWLLSVLSMGLVLRAEQTELFDLELREVAGVMLPSLTREYLASNDPDALPADPGSSSLPIPDPGEDVVWVLIDAGGQILGASGAADAADLPVGPATEGYTRTSTHVFFTSALNDSGIAVRVGDGRVERREVLMASFLAYLLPMLAILPLAYLIVGWTTRRALRPLDLLNSEIAARGFGRLDPIDGSGLPSELRAITATLNGQMIRLGQALDAERAFATNAAHELRTPLAVALAQVQRLRAGAEDSTDPRLGEVEDTLKRMGRLVERLLQLARAEAGLSTTDGTLDLRRVLEVTLDQYGGPQGGQAPKRIDLSLPAAPVMSRIDPDAFSIVAGNLIENALRHAPEGSPIRVVLSAGGTLQVMNEGRTLAPAELRRLTRRFSRRSTAASGLGLGLQIVESIVRQAGGTLTLLSPASDPRFAFEAAVSLPVEAASG